MRVLAADQQDLVDLVAAQARVGEDAAARAEGALDERTGEALELARG
jgi:hypothetical protein